MKIFQESSSTAPIGSATKTENIETSQLPKQSFKAFHSVHGSLEILQHEKIDNNLRFTLALQPPEDAQKIEVEIDMEKSYR